MIQKNIFMLAFLALTTCLANSADTQPPISWLPLADLTYVSNGKSHHLKLLQEQPPTPTVSGKGHCLLRKLEQVDDNGTNSLWMSCEVYSPYAVPHPVWSGALAWNEGEKSIYLLLAESISINTRLHIYKVNPTDSGLPIKYDAKGNPAADLYVVYRKPFAHYKKIFSINSNEFIVKTVDMQVNSDVISLRLSVQCRQKGDRNPRHVTTCSGPNIHFDLNKKTWTEDK